MTEQSDTRIPRKPSQSELPPFSEFVEQVCDDCGGSGRDVGGLNPYEFEPYPTWHGSGKETVLRRNMPLSSRERPNSA